MSASRQNTHPGDPERAVLVGRVLGRLEWRARVVSVRDGMAVDTTGTFRRKADLMDAPDAASARATAAGRPRWSLEQLAQAAQGGVLRQGTMLAPVSLHVVKTCSVPSSKA